MGTSSLFSHSIKASMEFYFPVYTLIVVAWSVCECVATNIDQGKRFLLDQHTGTDWVSWEQYAACTTSCVSGYEQRTRECCKTGNNMKCLMLPWATLKPLVGTCAVSGGWGQWSEWSVACGSQTRSRSCDSPTPKFGGATCIGNSTETVQSGVCTFYVDCTEIKQAHPQLPSAVYTITTWHTNRRVDVFCDMDTEGGGWTVFQRRFDGSVDFYRNFYQYTNGFGLASHEHWLGLRTIQEMISKTSQELRIDVEDFDGSSGYDVYSNFRLQGTGYTFYVDNRTRSFNMTDDTQQLSAKHHNTPYGQKFTTYDNDHDQSRFDNCAQWAHGAWWYDSCWSANLNGAYEQQGKRTRYMSFGRNYLRSTKIMFRPRNGN